MKSAFKFIGLVILASVVIVGGYLFVFPYVKYEHIDTSWRYKLTVEIETPEGVKTGSAVREVRVKGYRERFGERAGKGGGGNSFVTGEAVVIDLGPRGKVFALLGTYRHGADGWRGIVFDAFPWRKRPGGAMTMPALKYYTSLAPAGPVTLKPAQYPVFVRFRDQTDPKSIEKLLEYERCTDEHGNPRNTVCLKDDRFAEALGEGVKLKSVTIEMTKDPVTTSVLDILPWLPEYQNKMFDGQRFNTAGAKFPLANAVSSGAFKAGDDNE